MPSAAGSRLVERLPGERPAIPTPSLRRVQRVEAHLSDIDERSLTFLHNEEDLLAR
jgi:hypothetical protein